MTAPDEIWWGESPDHVMLATTADAVSGLRIDPARQAQVDALVGAGHVSVIDRRNTATTVVFTVTRIHASPAAARLFLWTHARAVAAMSAAPRSLHARFFSAVQDTFELARAVITAMPGEQKGASTTHSYSIVGAAIAEPLTTSGALTAESGAPLATEDGGTILP